MEPWSDAKRQAGAVAIDQWTCDKRACHLDHRCHPYKNANGLQREPKIAEEIEGQRRVVDEERRRGQGERAGKNGQLLDVQRPRLALRQLGAR